MGDTQNLGKAMRTYNLAGEWLAFIRGNSEDSESSSGFTDPVSANLGLSTSPKVDTGHETDPPNHGHIFSPSLTESEGPALRHVSQENGQ